MKKILCTLALFSIISKSFSQNDKGYIGVSLGPSIPMGDFSKKDGNDSSSGWANSGAIFDISFSYKLGKSNFGLTALLRGQANSTDAQSLANEIASLYPTVNWTVESGKWTIGGLMVGGFGSFPIAKKTSFDSRVMIGFLNSTSPEITITGSGPGGTAWIKQNSQSAVSFGYLIGCGLKFDIGNKLFLLTNLDYLGSKPEFSDVETIYSDGTRDLSTYKQSIGSLNISVGLALKL